MCAIEREFAVIRRLVVLKLRLWSVEDDTRIY